MEGRTSLKKGSGDVNEHNLEGRGSEQHVGDPREDGLAELDAAVNVLVLSLAQKVGTYKT